VARFPAVEVALEWDRRPDPADLNPNLEAIADAASKADIVVASIHAHRQGPWLEKVARQAIDRGSHIVLIHGPHEVRGVELYRGRPIFYALGDFVFETQYITRLPAEAYQRAGLSPDASPEALKDADVSELQKNREAFEALVAVLDFAQGDLSRLRLLPVDLNFDSKDGSRGRPQLASLDVAKRIVERAASRSARFGTKIRYDPDENVGVVVLG
jgi:poly-gamma-glutamate synthesis protein (capsule biosynthesis protein)